MVKNLNKAPVVYLPPPRVVKTSPPVKINRPLTKTELLCLALAADGYTNKEIAEIRSLSVLTIQAHMKHIVNAFGARNRAHVIAIGFRAGILDAKS